MSREEEEKARSEIDESSFPLTFFLMGFDRVTYRSWQRRRPRTLYICDEVKRWLGGG